MGYPYNSPIDDYFKSLSPEFIDGYAISDDKLNEIHAHKRAVEKFDADLYTYAKSLSTFVKDYAHIKTSIIDVYDSQMVVYEALNADKVILTDKKTALADEFFYMTENRTKLDNDLIQTQELLTYYETQLMANTITDVNSYIAEINADIVIIDNSLELILQSIPHYESIIDSELLKFRDANLLISDYTFESVVLKTAFELWQLRTEDYYQKLVEYYQSQYDLVWTGGHSIMYDKNMEYVDSHIKTLDNAANKLSSERIKQFNFNIEKQLKLYIIDILESEMNPQELQNKKIDKRLVSSKMLLILWI